MKAERITGRWQRGAALLGMLAALTLGALAGGGCASREPARASPPPPPEKTAGAAGELEARIQELERRLAAAEARLREASAKPPPGAPGTPGTPLAARPGAGPRLPEDARRWEEELEQRMDDYLDRLQEDWPRGAVGPAPQAPPEQGPTLRRWPRWQGTERPVLGVFTADLTPEAARERKLPDGTRGALVLRVVPDSGADLAGLAAGDVITELDGAPVASAEELRQALAAKQGGAKVQVRWLRDGKAQAAEAPLVAARERPLPPEYQPGAATPFPEETARRFEELRREMDELGRRWDFADPLAPAARDEARVEVQVTGQDGARITAAVWAPALVLDEALAQELALKPEEAERARRVYTTAREKLAAALKQGLGESGQLGDVAALIAEQAAAAEQELAGFLSAEQMAKLRAAHERTKSLRQELRIERSLGGGKGEKGGVAPEELPPGPKVTL